MGAFVSGEHNRLSNEPQFTAETAAIPLLARIAESTSGEIGDLFLASLVDSLRGAMDVSFAIISVGLGNPPRRLRSLYAWQDGGPVRDVEYDLAGTPCEAVFRGERLNIPCDLAKRFPMENGEGFEGYAGIPLHGRDGMVRGHFSVFSSRPFAAPEMADSVVRIFGARVQAEFLRLEAETERERLFRDLKHKSDRLLRRYEDLRTANEDRHRMLGILAHDLRNPLSVIAGRAELIRIHLARATPEFLTKADESCAETLVAVERMNGLIRSTIGALREESIQELSPSVFDLAAVVNAAVSVNRPNAERKNISISIEASDILDAEGDEDLLLSAVDNLVSNAVKYSYPGGSVRVTAGREEDSLMVRIADRGQGLDEDDLTRVFGRFVRLSALPTGGEESVGLGLFNVKDIVERHGGRVFAESEGKGKGAAFGFVLPSSSPKAAVGV